MMAIANNILTKFKGRIGMELKILNECKTAVEKITAIIEFINKITYVVGIDFVDNFYFNNRSMFTLLVICVIYWLLSYTFYMEFPALNCVELMGGYVLLITNLSKFASATCNHKKYMSLINYVFKMYNENVSRVREQILLDVGTKIVRHCKYVFAGMMFGLLVYGFYPVYDFLFNGNLTLVSPLMIPFVDNDTIEGYLVLTFTNIFACCIAIFGAYAFSCLFLTFVDVYDGLVSLIEDDFKGFDSMWVNKDQFIMQNRRTHAFRNVMMQLMDLARFNAYMKELFSPTVTAQIIGCYCGIVTALFGYLAVQLMNDFIGGIGASVYFLTELLIFCYIGQMLQNTNERILMVIYNSNWYAYEAKYQRDIMFVLNIFQNVDPLRIANLNLLNVETGLQIVNNIYSFLIFMLNVLE